MAAEPVFARFVQCELASGGMQHNTSLAAHGGTRQPVHAHSLGNLT
jgi:hypothetical protein